MSPPASEDDLAKVRRIIGPQLPEDAALCTGVEIVGRVAPLVGQAPRPAILFRFTHADGTVLPPCVLVLDVGDLHRLMEAVRSEGLQAILATQNFRGLS